MHALWLLHHVLSHPRLLPSAPACRLEQKAVAVLLTLLHLGVKNIRIGPNPPAFLTPEALKVVVDTFDLKVRLHTPTHPWLAGYIRLS